MAYPNRYLYSVYDIEFSPLAWYILTIQWFFITIAIQCIYTAITRHSPDNQLVV